MSDSDSDSDSNSNSNENGVDVDPILAGLFKEERAREEDAPLDAKQRILDRLETSFKPPTNNGGGGGGGGGSPGGGGSSSLLKLVGALVVGGAIGGGVVSAIQKPQIVYVDRVPVASSIVTASPATTPSAEPAMGLASTTREEAPPSGTSSASSSAKPIDAAAAADKSLVAERAILDVARTALGRGDGPHALEAVDRHAKEFPRGQMTEEREALAVQALAKMGRKAEASARGAQFKKRYPNSVLLVVIDAAIESVQ